MPPKHKGVSLQEKRDRILRIFTEKVTLNNYFIKLERSI